MTDGEKRIACAYGATLIRVCPWKHPRAYGATCEVLILIDIIQETPTRLRGDR